MSEAHTFELLQSPYDPAFDEFYAVYADSIVERERKSRAWISQMVERPDYVTVLLKQGGRVIGFSILFLPRSDSAGLLEYMAIAGGLRSRGLGAKLFRRTMEDAARHRGIPPPILLEVDSDREDSPDRILRARRQQFYRRLGCLRIAGLAYILPLPGETPPPEMDVFVYASGDLSSVAKAELRRWLQVVYQSVYNCPPEDSRIERMLLPLPDPVCFE